MVGGQANNKIIKEMEGSGRDLIEVYSLNLLDCLTGT
jgi:hypothetical protein